MDLIETPERARPGKGAVSRYGGATLLAALAMLLVQAALKAVIVAQAFFKEDDFAYAARSVESGFDPVRLTELYLGQFMPGGSPSTGS